MFQSSQCCQMTASDGSTIYHVTDEFLNMIKRPDSTCKQLNYLIVMPQQAEMQFQYTFPVGMGIVAASLKASGRTVFTLNLTYQKNPAEVLRATIRNQCIDVVLTGGLSGQYGLLKEIVDTAKDIRPDVITAVGGGIITADPYVAMCALENADYGMIGEGEITVNDLAYALETKTDPSDVAGVIVKGSENYTLRPEIMNLDCLPFPDYEGFDYIESFRRSFSGVGIKKNIGAVIITSRSCPYNCTFCFHSSGKKYRRRSLDVVFQEIDLMRKKFPLDYVQIADELFGNDVEYVKEFGRRIQSYGIRYLINTRLDRITDELLTVLRDSGCEEILFGIEHVSDKILQSMQKKTSAAIIEPTLRKCLQYGIRPIGNIILGDVAETEDTVQEALDWWRLHHNLGAITTTYLIVFPGSQIYKIALERGVIRDPVQFLRDGCPLVNMTTMPDDKWSEMKDRVAEYRILYEKTPDIDVDKLSGALKLLSQTCRCCVWPATVDSIRFFKKLSPEFYNKAYFVNINPDSQMLRAAENDVKVRTPDVIQQEAIDVVVCPRESLAEEIRVICQKEYPSVQRVICISELVQAVLEEENR